MSERIRVDRAAFRAERRPVDRRGDVAEPALAGQLRQAFAADELTAYYQPQYDLKTMDVVALEALCRWQHPRHGLLLPSQFIDFAERYKLIVGVGRFMLEECSGQLAAWRARGLEVGLSINASPSELSSEFADAVLCRVRELELPRRAVTIEITESPAIAYAREEILALETLIDGGVGVSIDDFGTGNTSLELVRRLPLTEVKIDKSLVQIPEPSLDGLVHEFLRIARERGARVVAEGIENQAHFERVLSWQCDRAQGYYFSPPMPLAQIEHLLFTPRGVNA